MRATHTLPTRGAHHVSPFAEILALALVILIAVMIGAIILDNWQTTTVPLTTTVAPVDTHIWRDAGAGGPRSLFVPPSPEGYTNVWRDAGAGGPPQLFGER
jgi:hypothetical protein